MMVRFNKKLLKMKLFQEFFTCLFNFITNLVFILFGVPPNKRDYRRKIKNNNKEN